MAKTNLHKPKLHGLVDYDEEIINGNEVDVIMLMGYDSHWDDMKPSAAEMKKSKQLIKHDLELLDKNGVKYKFNAKDFYSGDDVAFITLTSIGGKTPSIENLSKLFEVKEVNYFAKGGQTDSLYKIQQKYKYDLQPKWEDEKFQTGGRHFLTYKQAQEVKKKLQGLSSSMEYKVVKVEEKFAAGGKLGYKERAEKYSIKLAKAYQKLIDKNFDDPEYLKYKKLIEESQIPKEELMKIETYVATTPKGQQRPIDIYRYWGAKYAAGGELVDKTIDHSGRYLDIVGNHRMLHIHLNDEGREMVMEERENGRGDEEIMYELFEDVAGNSDLMYHTDLGESGFGMTDASGVTAGYMYGDDGELEPADDTAVVYVDNDSYRRSPVEELLETHLVLKNTDLMAKGGKLKKVIDKGEVDTMAAYS